MRLLELGVTFPEHLEHFRAEQCQPRELPLSEQEQQGREREVLGITLQA